MDNQEASHRIVEIVKEQDWDTDTLLSYYETFIYTYYLCSGFVKFLENMITVEKEVSSP